MVGGRWVEAVGSGWQWLVVVVDVGRCSGRRYSRVPHTLINCSTNKSLYYFNYYIPQWVTAMWGFATVTCSDLILPYSGSICDYLSGGTWR